MECVYTGSFVTIAAAEAADSWEVFIDHRKPLHKEDCWHQLKRSRLRVKVSAGMHRKYFGEYALDGRGWVFQERLFSRDRCTFLRTALSGNVVGAQP